jgi:hypothetical protein
MKPSMKAMAQLIGSLAWAALLYAGCVLWPLRLQPVVGYAVGGTVALFGIIQFIADLLKSSKSGWWRPGIGSDLANQQKNQGISPRKACFRCLNRPFQAEKQQNKKRRTRATPSSSWGHEDHAP